MDGERSKDPAQVVLDWYAAIQDRRIEDMLALAHPEISCYPLIRPGQTAYYGHDAIVKLMDDLHRMLGNYQLKIDKITKHDLPLGDVKVTVRSRTMPEPGRGQPAVVALTSDYTVHDGLITRIHSKPGNLAGTRQADLEHMGGGIEPALSLRTDSRAGQRRAMAEDDVNQ